MIEGICDYNNCEERGYYGNEYGTYCEKHWIIVKPYYNKKLKGGKK